MGSTALLCDALLGHVTDQSVADIIFSRATGSSGVQMKSGISDEIALKHYKGDLKKAATAVRATTSEAVLEKFAKDPRSSVRRAVAVNPHLGLKARQYLHTWGHAKRDYEVLQGVLPKMPVAEALAALPGMQISRREYPWAQLAEAVRFDGTAEAYELARSANHPELNALVAPQLYGDVVEGFPLSRYLEGFPDRDRAELLTFVSKSVRTLSADFVELVAQNEEEIKGQLYRSTTLFPSLRAVAPEAVKPILASECELLWVALAQTRVTPHTAHRLLEKESVPVTALLSTQTHRQLTSAMAEKAAPVLAAGEEAYSVARFLAEVTVPLSQDAVLSLLRGGNKDLTESWLMGALPHKPRPGEISALVASPGSAFTHRAGYYRYNRTAEAPSVADIASRLMYSIPEMLSKPWTNELVDSLGQFFFDLARNNQTLAKYMASRLERAFGTDSSLWEISLTLTDAWTSGLSELIDASFLATGQTPPEFFEEPLVQERPTIFQMELIPRDE